MVNPSVIVDNGSGSIKAGFAGEDNPRINLQSIIGRDAKTKEKHLNFLNFSTPEVYSAFKNGVLSKGIEVSYPINRGTVVNWDDMETMWRHTFFEGLSIAPQDYNILITEATSTPKPNREKTAQILFETFGFPALTVVQSSLLPLYAAGRTTGIVLDCGEGVTSTVPVWSGYPLPDAGQRLDVAGQDLNEFLTRLLLEGGYTSPHLEISRLIKEKLCVVSPDANKFSSEATTFQLPDGETVSIKNAKELCPELLFNPSLGSDSDGQGVQGLLYKSIQKTEVDIRKDMYANIILSGGSTLFPGFVDRVQKEITALAPPTVKVNVIASAERKYTVWMGASILASLTNFTNLLVSKREYEEGGPSVLHKNKG